MQPRRLPTLDWFCGGWIGGMQNAVNRLLQQPGLGDKQKTYLELVQHALLKASA